MWLVNRAVNPVPSNVPVALRNFEILFVEESAQEAETSASGCKMQSSCASSNNSLLTGPTLANFNAAKPSRFAHFGNVHNLANDI